MELRHWTQADAMELTSMCNAVDRHYLSDRLPNPYTEKDAEEWLKMSPIVMQLLVSIGL